LLRIKGDKEKKKENRRKKERKGRKRKVEKKNKFLIYLESTVLSFDQKSRGQRQD
jgi:hypothetical protein